MNLQEINRRIAGIKQRTSGNRVAIQEVAVGIIEHANEHGDCTAAVRLLRVIEPKLRPQVKAFFTAFSPINATLGKTANDDKARLRKPEQNDYNPFDLDGARANNWWEMAKPDPVAKPFDLNAFRTDMAKTVKRWEKALEDGKVPADSVEAIKADIAEFHAAAQACGQRQNTPLREVPLQAVVNG